MLVRAVKSVAIQTYPNKEIIIVNDSPELFDENHIRKAANGVAYRILQNQRTAGAPGARNTGFLASKGDLISFLDDDDEWLPQKLEKQVTAFQSSHDRVAIVFSEHYIVEKEKRVRVVWNVEGNVYEALLKSIYLAIHRTR